MASETQQYALPRIVRVFWVASTALFALMFVVRYIEHLAGFPLSYNHFLGPRFTDLMEYVGTFKLLHTQAFWRNPATPSVAYPPAGAVLFGLLYSFGKPVAFYLAIAAVGLALAVWGIRRALVRRGIAGWEATLFPLTILGASFPIAGLLQSGNLELLVWLFAATGVWLFLRGQADAAGVMWGLAAATKLYPVIFLALLLPGRRYRAFAVGAATFVGASVLAMGFMGPSIPAAWHGSLQNVFAYQGVRVAQWNLHELATNHSVFGLAKLAATIVGFPLGKLTLPYYAVGALVFAGVFFSRVAKMPVVNQLLAVSVFMLMLPPVSYFYTLVHLYAPWLQLVFVAISAEREGSCIPGLHVTMLLFLPLFASFTLLTFPQVLLFGGLVQACLLIALFFCAATFPFGSEQSGQAEL